MLPLSAGAETPAVITIEMREYIFQPATIALPAGRPARLVLVNRGRIAHQFEAAYLRTLPSIVVSGAVRVEAPGLDLVRLDPDGTARLEFFPRVRGRFTFACTIEGHREAGMHGILEVR